MGVPLKKSLINSFLSFFYQYPSSFINFLPLTFYFFQKENIDALTLVKVLSRGAIFLATCKAILLLGDVKLANTCFHHTLLIRS